MTTAKNCTATRIDNPGIVACGDDAAEIAWANDLTGVRIEFAGSAHCIEVTDRVRQIATGHVFSLPVNSFVFANDDSTGQFGAVV